MIRISLSITLLLSVQLTFNQSTKKPLHVGVVGMVHWPFARKDMEIYGQMGYVFTVNGTKMRIRLKDEKAEHPAEATQADAPASDSFTYLTRLLHGETKPDELTSLENNMIVMEILDAARQSEKTGKAVSLKPKL